MRSYIDAIFCAQEKIKSHRWRKRMLNKFVPKFGESNVLLKVLALLKPVMLPFLVTTVLAISLAILTPLRPHLIQIAVDDYIFVGDGAGLLQMIYWLFALLITTAVSRYCFIYMSGWLGQTIIKDLRVKVFEHMVALRLRFFDQTPIGAATTRTINDVEAINDIFAAGIINIVADVLTILVIIAFMFSKSWSLTVVCLITFPFFIYATLLFKEGIKASYQKVRTQVSRLNTFVQEHISGMSVIQAFGAEEQEMQKFKDINGLHRDAHIQSIWYYSIFFPAIEIIQAAGLGLLVWFGSTLVIKGGTSLGVLIAFIMYLSMLFRPLRQLADKFNTLQMGLVAAGRVFEVLDRKEFIKDEGTIAKSDFKGDIDFENVWFAYNEKDFVIKDVSFKVEAGKTLAIVGATGAGKSSVINILNRFYPIQKGSIKVDGVDIREYSLQCLRRNIGLVLQDVFLFSGSIMENITLRNPDISKEKVEEAARMIGADQFINKLPGKYDYEVMERGATLSMGQRQLISFIRTMVYDPRILILDEATSSIDTETEELVQEAVRRLIVGRTSIVIAHRLSTIQEAHQIMVLDKGELMEMGSHDDLMEEKGLYRALYDKQFGLTESVA